MNFRVTVKNPLAVKNGSEALMQLNKYFMGERGYPEHLHPPPPWGPEQGCQLMITSPGGIIHLLKQAHDCFQAELLTV